MVCAMSFAASAVYEVVSESNVPKSMPLNESDLSVASVDSAPSFLGRMTTTV